MKDCLQSPTFSREKTDFLERMSVSAMDVLSYSLE